MVAACWRASWGVVRQVGSGLGLHGAKGPWCGRNRRVMMSISLRPSDSYMRHQINHHWFRQWHVACPAPSHYLNHAGMLLIGPFVTNASEILVGIHTFSFKKMQLQMSSGKWRKFCISLSVLNSEAASKYIQQCGAYTWAGLKIATDVNDIDMSYFRCIYMLRQTRLTWDHCFPC